MKEISSVEALFAAWNKADDIEELFERFLYDSEVFEDEIESVIKRAYKDGLRCTQITQAYCKERGLFDNLDYDNVIDVISDRERIDFADGFVAGLKQFVSTDKTFFNKVYECISDWYRIVISEMNQHESADISDANQLEELKDEKGDVHTTGNGFTIDEPVRDYPFIFYDGKYFNWDNEMDCKSHSEIIDKCFGEGRAKSVNLRDIENIDGLDATKPIIFGDKIGDICFIEACQNMPVEEAADILRERARKVYQYQQTENCVERLARKG